MEMKDIILATERLYLREMNQNDFHSLCRILQDNDTMYAYEGAFCDAEGQQLSFLPDRCYFFEISL